MYRGEFSNIKSGFGVSKLIEGTIALFLSISTVLMIEAMPDTVPVWPRLLITELMGQ